MKKASLIIMCFILSIITSNAQVWNPLGLGIWPSSTHGTNWAASIAEDTANHLLYVGGHFDSVGNFPANAIATWDGTKWDSLGSGIGGGSGLTSVYAICKYKNRIYVGGYFQSAGGLPVNNIAVWDGTKWDSLGAGINDAGIESMLVYNGLLYICGAFSKAGNINANHIATWDGIKWDSVGSGFNAEVAGMANYNGNLYAGGYFTYSGNTRVNYVAEWNGSNWIPLSNGVNNTVWRLISYNGALYTCGQFDSAGRLPAHFIAKWSGSAWSSLTKGLSGAGSVDVQGMAVYNGDLYVGGLFDTAGDVPARNIATWDGSHWKAVGIGTQNHITVLTEYNGLYVGGSFDTAGGIIAHKIALFGASAGINSLSNSNTSTTVYPNPSNGQFTIQVINEVVQANKNIEIYNVMGQEVFSQRNIQNSTFKLNLTNQPNGVYLYRILDETGNLVSEGKIVLDK